MKLVNQGKRFGKIASLVGLGILIAGLVVSFRTPMIWLAYGCLIVGFILSNIGIYLANRWVREPRADQTLTKVLKGFDNQYALYNYYLPAQHVLLTPTGVIVFVVKPQNGEIRCEGNRWRHKLTIGRVLRFLTEEGLGNPTQEARQETESLQRLIRKHVTEGDVPVSAFIVFTSQDEKLRLEVVNPAIPVLRLRELKERMRKLSKGKPIPTEIQQKLTEAFDAAVPA